MTETMQENALYRTYRPQTFAQIIGQEAEVRALTRAVEDDRVSHAYLFSGPRGTGKTSTALILAKALNCLDRQGAEPCNACESCVTINKGNSLDVVEYDSATHSGVDAMREILSKVSLASPGKKKVVIFDECHMLSTSASSALLTTLERPPAHVIFIFATTDLNKVLGTIRSRCQKWSFRLIHPDVLFTHLKNVAEDAGLQVSDEIIQHAVLQGNGSVRDSLSALDALALSGDVAISYAATLTAALASSDLATVFKTIAQSQQDGNPARGLAEETLGLLRECFLIQMGASELLTTPDWGSREATAKALGPKKTVMAIEFLAEAITAMQSDHDSRINLEVALARYCKMTAA